MPPPHRRPIPHGITRTDAAALVVFVVIAIAFVALLAGRPTCGGRSRVVRDAAQLRTIAHALALLSEDHGGHVPLPSAVDADGDTVDVDGPRKDVSANLFSLAVYAGLVPVETLVSPVEPNDRIAVDDDYAYDAPPAAVRPDRARWDPAFAADFTEGPANLSYAHLPPARLGAVRWAPLDPATPVLANRGPRVANVRYVAGRAAPAITNPRSLTFLAHGTDDMWEGHVVHTDGSARFAFTLAPDGLTYQSTSGTRPDVLFYDEPDDIGPHNTFLSVFVDPGPAGDAYRAVWD